MKVELFPFQKVALARLRQSVAMAIGNYKVTNVPQVVSYTAPTGAGKTIIAAALIEDIFFGSTLADGTTFEENAVIKATANKNDMMSAITKLPDLIIEKDISNIVEHEADAIGIAYTLYKSILCKN